MNLGVFAVKNSYLSGRVKVLQLRSAIYDSQYLALDFSC
ncbi:MAG: hypothetical protein OFPII_26550 [Osedax symbiont Rs1]|nr:MAG: hypothetical protein OFPII_26550 [Osedax symbiont Rs1]